MIDDEIQSGLARSGRMLACDWEEVRPDVVVGFFVVPNYFQTPEYKHNSCSGDLYLPSSEPNLVSI